MPVVDAVGARVLQAKPLAFFGEDRALDVTPHHIQVADAEYHFGVSDPRRIEVVKLDWMEQPGLDEGCPDLVWCIGSSAH